MYYNLSIFAQRYSSFGVVTISGREVNGYGSIQYSLKDYRGDDGLFSCCCRECTSTYISSLRFVKVTVTANKFLIRRFLGCCQWMQTSDYPEEIG